jgi:hypothetical protein
MPVSFTANTSVECLADDVTCALEDDPISGPLRKLGKTLGEFATYISNNAGYIVNYGERFRAGERISTGFVESAVNQIVDKRFDKRQSMRWTPRGAHLLFQTRTRVLNASTATSINSSVAVTQRSGNRQATTLPPFCDGLPSAGLGERFARVEPGRPIRSLGSDSATRYEPTLAPALTLGALSLYTASNSACAGQLPNHSRWYRATRRRGESSQRDSRCRSAHGLRESPMPPVLQA